MLSERTPNNQPTIDDSRHNAALLPAMGAGLALLAALAGVSAIRAAAGAEGGFQPYRDAAAGFALARPDGWHVRSEGTSIRVESPDSSELVMIRAFKPEPEQTATAWLRAAGGDFSAMFPQLGLDHSQHVQTPASGDEVVADMHYQGQRGAAKARVLCRIKDGKGLLYVFAAPTARYSADQVKLLHVAKSLQFLASRGAGQEGGSGAVTSSQVAAAARQVHWVKWTDPRERAFSIGIPQGWTAEGGTFREEGGNVNFAYVVTSPTKDIGVSFGSPSSIQFLQPGSLSASMGWREGTNGVLHYMRAPEFNEMYLRQRLGNGIEGLTIGEGQEIAQMSEQLTRQAAQVMGNGTTVSLGVTDFKGTDKKTGKPCTGTIMSTTMRTESAGVNGQIVNWSAQPSLVISNVGDGKDSERLRTALAVFSHVSQSFVQDPRWAAQRDQQFHEHMQSQHESAMANIAAAGERSKQIAAQNNAAQDAIMGRYNRHVSAGNTQQSAFANFMGDRTDVTDGSGHTSNVGSGYSHYYKNDRTGDILGTNSAYSPGVDFSVMTEH